MRLHHHSLHLVLGTNWLSDALTGQIVFLCDVFSTERVHLLAPLLRLCPRCLWEGKSCFCKDDLRPNGIGFTLPFRCCLCWTFISFRILTPRKLFLKCQTLSVVSYEPSFSALKKTNRTVIQTNLIYPKSALTNFIKWLIMHKAPFFC